MRAINTPFRHQIFLKLTGTISHGNKWKNLKKKKHLVHKLGVKPPLWQGACTTLHQCKIVLHKAIRNIIVPAENVKFDSVDGQWASYGSLLTITHFMANHDQKSNILKKSYKNISTSIFFAFYSKN